jgi:hypothetical protein
MTTSDFRDFQSVITYWRVMMRSGGLRVDWALKRYVTFPTQVRSRQAQKEQEYMNPSIESFLAASPGNAAILRARCLEDGEYVISDGRARIVGVQPTLERAARLVKHHLPDGDYSIVGPATDLIVTRKDGIVYPTGGQVAGGTMPPRSVPACEDVFGEG